MFTVSAASQASLTSEFMFKTLPYLKIPYRHNGDIFDGCDCYGLISLIYREELGIQLTPFKAYDTYKELADDYCINHAEDEFFPIEMDELQPYDVLLIQTDRPAPTHITLYIGDGKIIHISAQTRRTQVERLNTWKDRVRGCYRHLGRK